MILDDVIPYMISTLCKYCEIPYKPANQLRKSYISKPYGLHSRFTGFTPF